MEKLTHTQFVDKLKAALVHLYDTEYLRRADLLSVFHIENSSAGVHRFDAGGVDAGDARV